MQITTENIWSVEAQVYFLLILEIGSLPLSLHLDSQGFLYSFRQRVLFRYSVEYNCVVSQAKPFCQRNTLQLDFFTSLWNVSFNLSLFPVVSERGSAHMESLSMLEHSICSSHNRLNYSLWVKARMWGEPECETGSSITARSTEFNARKLVTWGTWHFWAEIPKGSRNFLKSIRTCEI